MTLCIFGLIIRDTERILISEFQPVESKKYWILLFKVCILFWLPDMQIPTVLRQFVLLHLQSHWLCRVCRNSVVDGKVFGKEIHLTRNLLLNVLHNFEWIISVPRIIQRDTIISIGRVSYKVPVQLWLTTLIPTSRPHPPYVKSSSSLHRPHPPYITSSSSLRQVLILPTSRPHPPYITSSSSLRQVLILPTSSPHPPYITSSSSLRQVLILPTSSPHPPYITSSSSLRQVLILPTSSPHPPYITSSSSLHHVLILPTSWIILLQQVPRTVLII
jgi:hypothetical protein